MVPTNVSTYYSQNSPNAQANNFAAQRYGPHSHTQEKKQKLESPSSKQPQNLDTAPENKKKTATVERSGSTWKPVVAYYNDETPSKIVQSQVQSQCSHKVDVGGNQVEPGEIFSCTSGHPSTNVVFGTNNLHNVDENLPPRGKNMAESLMQTDDLIDFAPSAFAHVQANFQGRETHPMPGNADLLSDVFGEVSLSERRMGFRAMTPDLGRGNAGTKGGCVPPNAPEGLREALEINKSGKAVTWNWSEEPPQAREVTEEECEGIQPTPALDEFISKRWERPWLAQKLQAAASTKTMPMEIDR